MAAFGVYIIIHVQTPGDGERERERERDQLTVGQHIDINGSTHVYTCKCNIYYNVDLLCIYTDKDRDSLDSG